MTIQSGTRLGPYDVVSRVGAGGMGEVWRAHDPRIGRDVAVKVLPPSFSSDTEHLRRFEQEAKTAGSLSHPNLVTLYELGSHEGSPYIAMELLDGQTLRDKIGDGETAHPLPYRKALEYAAQLATGLAAAHEKGVVHRDLKPENIFVTRDGRLKILDFGLAKLRGPFTVNADDDHTQQKGTSPGTILGTAGYMSPEQVRGYDVDHRSDIFSFGAIFYELLSGRRAFRRTSSVETMNAILTDDPPEISSTQHISPAVERIIRRCLEKNAEERFQSARDLAFALEAVGTSTSSHDAVATSLPQPSRWLTYAGWLLALLAAAAAGALAMSRFASPAAGVQKQTFAQLTFDTGIERDPSIAPDGKTFVFVRGIAPRREIYTQRVDGGSAIVLSRSPDHDDHAPVFSPDGNQVAFRSERDGGGIFLMGATGESVRRLTSTGFDPSWSPDGTEIIFASEETLSPTSRNSVSSVSAVSVATGAIRKLFEGDAMQPRMSPNRLRILYWALPPAGGQRDIYTVAMSGDPKSVVRATDDVPLDWDPVWAPDGKSIFFASDRNGTMNVWRLEIDEASGQVRGEPQPLAAPAASIGGISVDLSGRNLLYASVATSNELRRGTFDPATEKFTTEAEPVFSGSMLIRDASPSPDGKWIAFSTESRQEDVYVMRSDGTDVRRLTSDVHRDRGVSWSPDSRRIFFYSTRSGTYDAWSIGADGSGLTQHTAGTQVNFPVVSPDGRRVAFFDIENARAFTLAAKPVSSIETLPPIPDSSHRFWPRGWSPDGTKLVGIEWAARDNPRLFVYSFPQRAYKVVRHEGTLSLESDTKWIDNDRILVAAGKVSVSDLRTNSVRMVGEADNARSSSDGRHIVMTARRTDSDIWRMALGTDATTPPVH